MTVPMTPNTNSTVPLGQAPASPQTTVPAAGAAAPPPLPMSIGVKKKLPNGVCANVKQHVVFLLDESSSMAGYKIQELEMAMGAILLQLADPTNKDGFRVTIIPFNHGSRVHCSGEPASSVPALNLNASGGTNFDSAILKAIQAIMDFKAQPNPGGWHFLQAQALILSDGQSQVANKNIQDLQELANVTAVAYGADADEATLARIASDRQVHVVGDNGGALRDFLAAVGATMVSTIKTAM